MQSISFRENRSICSRDAVVLKQRTEGKASGQRDDRFSNRERKAGTGIVEWNLSGSRSWMKSFSLPSTLVLLFFSFFFHVSHSIDSCNPCLSCVGDLNDRSISRPTDPLLFDSFDRFWKWREHVKYFDRIKSKIVGPISRILYRLR